MLSRVGLFEERHRKIAEVAYGRQRLVEIAIALSLKPKVLLLDEPAAGIPTSETSIVLDAIGSLPREIAVLMIEHDMHIVRSFAEDVTVLVGGRVLCTGKPAEVIESEQVKSLYLGRSGAARLSAVASHA